MRAKPGRPKVFVVATALLAVLLAAGCGRQQPASTPAPQQAVAGVVATATADTFTLQTDDGQNLLFAFAGAEIEAGSRGLLAGDRVQVVYSGALPQDGTPARAVRVVLLEETSATLDGVVTAFDGDILSLNDADGAGWRFFTTGAEMDTAGHPLEKGDAVQLTYAGQLDPTQEVQPVSLSRINLTTRMENTVAGVATDTDGESLALATTSGQRYRFSTKAAVILPGENGLIPGDMVTVTYTGTLDAAAETQPVEVLRVEVSLQISNSKPGSSSGSSSSAPASSGGTVWSRPSSSQGWSGSGDGTGLLPNWPGDGSTGSYENFVSGTVLEAGSGTLSIETAAGSQYWFSTEGATGAEGLTKGDTVAIFFVGTLAPGQAVQPVLVTRVSVTGWGGSAVTGTVLEYKDATLTLQVSDTVKYSFNIKNADIQAGASGLAVGRRASVYYTGTLDTAAEAQTVTVVRVIAG